MEECITLINENEFIGPTLEQEHLNIFLEWFENYHENFYYEDKTIVGIKIENIQKFLELKKFNIRDFHYPTYEEFMTGIEKLKAVHFVNKEQYMLLLQQWLITPKIKEELLLAFKAFDTEKRGFIAFDQLKTILTCMGETFDENELIEIMRDADFRGDGNINYREFTESMFSLIPELYNLKVEYLYEDPDEDPNK